MFMCLCIMTENSKIMDIIRGLYATLHMWPTAIVLNYSVKNVRNNVQQIRYVPERCKYAMSDRTGFESEKEKDDNLQPTKKQCTKLSAPKEKQGTSLNSYR